MTVIGDFRDTWRSLARSPYFTIPVVLSLAFAIGANVAAFSIVNTLVLRPLPVREPDRLFRITYVDDARTSEGGNYSWFAYLRERSRSVEQAFIAHRASMHVAIDGRVEAVGGLLVSGGYFQGLGLTPQIGRLMTTDDERGEAPRRVAVISDAYWTTRFGRSASTVGSTIRVNGVPHVVIGVTRPEFFGVEVGRRVDITVPLDASEYRRGWVTMALIVRLPAGADPSAASQELNAHFKAFASEIPARAGLLAQRVELASIAHGITAQGTVPDRFTRPAAIVSAMLGIMLLLACANWAMLLLARTSARRRDMAIRLALGSSRLQLGRRPVIESVTLALAGGTLGLLAASWAVAALPGSYLPPGLSIETDARVVSFAVAVALLAGTVFAAAPAWLTRRVDADVLRMTARIDDPRGGRVGRTLVAAQVVLSVMVIAAAGFFGATVRNLQAQEMGFSGDGVVTFTLDADGTGLEGEPLKALHGRLLDALRAMPGVQHATLASVSPLSGNDDGKGITIPGFVPPSPDDTISNVNTVAPGYFETYGIRVRRGRAIEASDGTAAPHVALVSESAARYYFGDRDPIGQRMEIRGSTTLRPEIVGIAADVMYDDLRSGAERMFYVPFAQRFVEGEYQFAVRTAGDPGILMRDVPEVVAAVVPDMPVLAIGTVARQIEARAGNERLLSAIATTLGALALLLAGIGVYGIVAYTVHRRTPELGLRMALGASRTHVLWYVSRGSLTVVAIGIAIGTVLAVASSTALASTLYGVERTDARVYAGAAAALLAAAAIAVIPAVVRALRIQPVAALRYE